MIGDEITKVIDAIADKFGVAIDWTSENIIPYVENLCSKYISYEIWTSVALTVFFAMLFTICLIVTIKVSVPMANKDDWDPDYGGFWLGMFSIITCVALGITVVAVGAVQIHDIITCATFPEKQILEYVTGLLSTQG